MKKQLASLLLAAAVLSPAASAQTTASAPAAGQTTLYAAIGGAIGVLGVGLFLYTRRRKEAPPPERPPVAAPPPAAKKPAPPPGPVLVSAPPDFDAAVFLTHAKASFVRMQAAWDKADSADLSQFTTPQIFAELNAQVQQRGPSSDLSEVVTINAELLGCDTVGTDYVASVKFSGTIKPSAAAPAEAFAEIWNMSKPMQGSGGWVLAGIQQLS